MTSFASIRLFTEMADPATIGDLHSVVDGSWIHRWMEVIIVYDPSGPNPNITFTFFLFCKFCKLSSLHPISWRDSTKTLDVYPFLAAARSEEQLGRNVCGLGFDAVDDTSGVVLEKSVGSSVPKRALDHAPN